MPCCARRRLRTAAVRRIDRDPEDLEGNAEPRAMRLTRIGPGARIGAQPMVDMSGLETEPHLGPKTMQQLQQDNGIDTTGQRAA
ncbi:hypothetical protein C662_02955 [Thauera sp. 28]|nr:hypothetical protein C662_02955 [Thauera sp. 28]